jgi:hypothetical protein
MGTSTNYAGSPNWAAAKTETTKASGDGFVTPEKANAIVSGFVEQMTQASQLGFGPALSTGAFNAGAGGGGAARIGSGSGGGGGGSGGRSAGTRTSGGSARTIARGLGSFLATVAEKGFADALAEIGLTNIAGKSPDEVALALADLLGGEASLIEEAALREALLNLTLEWAEGVDAMQEFEAVVTSVANDIESVLHQFLGHYIFEVFKTVGYQGVLDKHGFEQAERMADQIREFINAKVAGVASDRKLSTLDWNGAEGATVVDGIVADTIAIFGEPKK